MVDLRDVYDKPWWNAESFEAYLHEHGLKPEEGAVFTISECKEIKTWNNQKQREEDGHAVYFHETHKALILTTGVAPGLFNVIGSETEEWPEKRIRLFLYKPKKDNTLWIRVANQRLPAASDPIGDKLAAVVGERLSTRSATPDGFLRWADSTRHPILERFPFMKPDAVAAWPLGVMDALKEYVDHRERELARESQDTARAAAETARDAGEEPPPPAKEAKPAEPDKQGYTPLSEAKHQPITDDDIPF